LCYDAVDEKIRLHEQIVARGVTRLRGLNNHFVTEADKTAVKSPVNAP
jgi:hypothetical protein